MADVAQSHPELVRRWELLVERCWARSWDVWISSSSRSLATQREWYHLYHDFVPPRWPAIVADPDRDAGATPFGWRARGSLHMIQEDGYSHALDVGINGPVHPNGTPNYDEFHALAWTCGLGHPEPTEYWHLQAFDAYSYGFYPVEDEMTPEQLGLIRDPKNPDNPVYGLMLVETVDTSTNPITTTEQWYPYATWAKFIHQRDKVWDALHP